MLRSEHRLRSSLDFGSTVRNGVRVGRPTLVVHARLTDNPPSRVGFVVSKAVGGAVTRNRVKRRLRHLVKDALVQDQTTDRPAADIVVRALPAAATDSERLATDLSSAWQSARRRMDDQQQPDGQGRR
ncbi:ribonuclease P protein component [Parenemella sanctibonifatiensis]|uniref:Ribonuclease P protein component n=1 Tax=Parenemella sanctibonifatiensis TaxID=2016505 RepID=A0A255EMP0_9ACTN|nr:ribonuclease P protein component [Parenemella sanctibonifatiensis]OYN90722.1 ribonuclease P protein component [Parenemella sanctibonifatiensis]